MIIHDSKFVKSSCSFDQCPTKDILEFAFIGRSNVGKSSLINMMLNRKKLAKVSGTPGKTQLINHFEINNVFYLVDLPGYGWAKISKQKKANWERMTKNYFTKRHNLACVFVLIDSRLQPQKIDLNFVNWLGMNKVPLAIIFTKLDKKSSYSIEKLNQLFKKELLKEWAMLPKFFYTSSVFKKGKDDILNYIDEILLDYKRV